MDKRENEPNIINHATLTGLLGDDQVAIRQFQLVFLKDARISLKNQSQLLAETRFQEVKEEVHYLKTSALSVGAEQVAATLQKMEQASLDRDQAHCHKLFLQLQKCLKQYHQVLQNEIK